MKKVLTLRDLIMCRNVMLRHISQEIQELEQEDPEDPAIRKLNERFRALIGAYN